MRDEFQEVADRLEELRASIAQRREEFEANAKRQERINWWINFFAILAVLSIWGTVLFLTPAP